jgi:hypothetical protein
MLNGVPQVPQSREEFQSFLRTGAIPLRPSFYSRFVLDHPGLKGSVYEAASEGSALAEHVTFLVRYFKSSAGKLALLSPQVSPLAMSMSSHCGQTFKKAEHLESCGTGQDEEFVGQRMTAFTAALWQNLEGLAPNCYDLTCDRNKKPNRSTSDAKPTEVRLDYLP